MMWQHMLESSVWLTTSKETRIVWVTMLLMKGADGVVRAMAPGIAHRAVVSLEECRKALKILSEPDTDTLTQEHEGRRIKRVAEGWLVLNHEKYRTSEDLKEKWRRQKAEQRMRKKSERSKTAESRERAFVRATEEGDERRANQIVDRTGVWAEEPPGI